MRVTASRRFLKQEGGRIVWLCTVSTLGGGRSPAQETLASTEGTQHAHGNHKNSDRTLAGEGDRALLWKGRRCNASLAPAYGGATAFPWTFHVFFCRARRSHVLAGCSAQEIDGVLARGERITLAEALRCRVRYFCDGVVLGCREFVEEYFATHPGHFGRTWRSDARVLRGIETGELRILRALRLRRFG